ncbi:hypothetical protein [Micromonospora sp. WMMD712]|uniref:hypothetical protein n=1 Tax=Micromonospora TaxID=1873 RepID=UPI00249A197C|nr:hypothetical protein [Micromonospora sp. WMMD712]WFE59875.1 hypothetical protein O7633_24845 [Micromonospora sp. WMMD712]
MSRERSRHVGDMGVSHPPGYRNVADMKSIKAADVKSVKAVEGVTASQRRRR